MTVIVGDQEDFVLQNTSIEATQLVPEVKLHLATSFIPLWEASEQELETQGVPPPYWAFAWAGGQALARYLLDNPEAVAGKRVLDFGSGSGLQGLAAVKAGAARVEAVDIDPYACAAVRLNARINGLVIEVSHIDVVGRVDGQWDVVLAGDVCYERPMADRVEAWLRQLAATGVLVLLGDPGRTYMPRDGLDGIAGYSVRTTREIEDTDLKNAVVWQVLPAA